ncbi:hypothetical protein AO268_08940 [Pseudomonas sp. ICMP 8385]|nr:hypothetical protein AO268_08940 [Pseudomonas sp. ICMP 8385]
MALTPIANSLLTRPLDRPEDGKRIVVILSKGLYGDWLKASAADSMGNIQRAAVKPGSLEQGGWYSQNSTDHLSRIKHFCTDLLPLSVALGII